MYWLNKYISDSGFFRLLFGGKGLKKAKAKNKGNKYKYHIRDNDNMTNILNFNLIKLFKNLKTIWIHDVQYENRYYSFSLYQLALLLEKTKIQKVELFTVRTLDDSWLCCLWRDKSSSIIEAYKNRGYAIEFDESRHELEIKLL